jgi:hypothetical protein
VEKIFADGVRRALIPAGMFRSLLRGENFDKTSGKRVEHIGRIDVKMERSGVKLGNYVNLAQFCVDTVGDGDVHEPEFPSKRHCRLGA